MRNSSAARFAVAALLLALCCVSGPLLAEAADASTSSSSSDDSSSSGASNGVTEDADDASGTSERLVGGPQDVSADNDEIREILNGALKAIAGQGGANFVTKRVINVTQQVVSGTLHTICAEFGDASADASSPGTVCKLKVWSRLWLNQTEYTMTCEPSAGEEKRVYRAKRSLLYDQYQQANEDIGYHMSTYLSDSELALEQQFGQFERDFGRSYATATERQMRRRVFAENLLRIRQFNEYEMGTAEYGVTQFADRTEEEFRQWTGLRQRTGASAEHRENELRNLQADIPQVAVPQAFDWRDRGVISAVKNQGQCGSCWAFSVIGNIEGLHAIRSGHLDEYSEQELVDCDTEDNGCNGGLPDNAYKAIEKLGGLELEHDYPYAAKGQKCKLDPAKVRVRVKGAVDLPANETAMAQWLTVNGPLSIGLNANAMQFYRGGVSHPFRALCAHSKIDHGVLIVGFGQSDYPLFNKTLPYWIVKNSWGSSWGEKGYYRVYRGDNTCGINSMVSSAVLAD